MYVSGNNSYTYCRAGPKMTSNTNVFPVLKSSREVISCVKMPNIALLNLAFCDTEAIVFICEITLSTGNYSIEMVNIEGDTTETSLD